MNNKQPLVYRRVWCDVFAQRREKYALLGRDMRCLWMRWDAAFVYEALCQPAVLTDKHGIGVYIGTSKHDWAYVFMYGLFMGNIVVDLRAQSARFKGVVAIQDDMGQCVKQMWLLWPLYRLQVARRVGGAHVAITACVDGLVRAQAMRTVYTYAFRNMSDDADVFDPPNVMHSVERDVAYFDYRSDVRVRGLEVLVEEVLGVYYDVSIEDRIVGYEEGSALQKYTNNTRSDNSNDIDEHALSRLYENEPIPSARVVYRRIWCACRDAYWNKLWACDKIAWDVWSGVYVCAPLIWLEPCLHRFCFFTVVWPYGLMERVDGRGLCYYTSDVFGVCQLDAGYGGIWHFGHDKNDQPPPPVGYVLIYVALCTNTSDDTWWKTRGRLVCSEARADAFAQAVCVREMYGIVVEYINMYIRCPAGGFLAYTMRVTVADLDRARDTMLAATVFAINQQAIVCARGCASAPMGGGAHPVVPTRPWTQGFYASAMDLDGEDAYVIPGQTVDKKHKPVLFTVCTDRQMTQVGRTTRSGAVGKGVVMDTWIRYIALPPVAVDLCGLMEAAINLEIDVEVGVILAALHPIAPVAVVGGGGVAVAAPVAVGAVPVDYQHGPYLSAAHRVAAASLRRTAIPGTRIHMPDRAIDFVVEPDDVEVEGVDEGQRNSIVTQTQQLAGMIYHEWMERLVGVLTRILQRRLHDPAFQLSPSRGASITARHMRTIARAVTIYMNSSLHELCDEMWPPGAVDRPAYIPRFELQSQRTLMNETHIGLLHAHFDDFGKLLKKAIDGDDVV